MYSSQSCFLNIDFKIAEDQPVYEAIKRWLLLASHILIFNFYIIICFLTKSLFFFLSQNGSKQNRCPRSRFRLWPLKGRKSITILIPYSRFAYRQTHYSYQMLLTPLSQKIIIVFNFWKNIYIYTDFTGWSVTFLGDRCCFWERLSHESSSPRKGLQEHTCDSNMHKWWC